MINLILLYYKIFKKGEYQDMAVIYATLIVKGLKTINDVPALIRPQVEEILTALEVNV